MEIAEKEDRIDDWLEKYLKFKMDKISKANEKEVGKNHGKSQDSSDSKVNRFYSEVNLS